MTFTEQITFLFFHGSKGTEIFLLRTLAVRWPTPEPPIELSEIIGPHMFWRLVVPIAIVVRCEVAHTVKLSRTYGCDLCHLGGQEPDGRPLRALGGRQFTLISC